MEKNDKFLGKKRTLRDTSDDEYEPNEMSFNLISKGILSYYLFEKKIEKKVEQMEVYLLDKNWIKKEIKKYNYIIENNIKKDKNEIISILNIELSKEYLTLIKYPIMRKIEDIYYYNNYTYINEETLNYFIEGFGLENENKFPKVIFYRNNEKDIDIIEYNKNNIKIVDCHNIIHLFKKITRYVIEFSDQNLHNELINKALNEGMSFIHAYDNYDNYILNKIKIKETNKFYYLKLKAKTINNHQFEINDTLKKNYENIHNILEKIFKNNYYLKAFTNIYCFENLIKSFDRNNYKKGDNEYEVYLIDKNWMNNWKNMYSYEKAEIFLKFNINLLLDNTIYNIQTFNNNFKKEILDKINTKDFIEPLKFCKKRIINLNNINISYFVDFEFIDYFTFKTFERLYDINSGYPEIKCKISLLKDNTIIIEYNNSDTPSFQILVIRNNKISENYLIKSTFNINEIKNTFKRNNFNNSMSIFGINNRNFAKEKINYNNIYIGDIYNINNINPLYNPKVFDQPKNNNIFNNKTTNNRSFTNIGNTGNTSNYYYNNLINLSFNSFFKNDKIVKKQVIMNKPSLIGLDNIGATCYMNASLQCMSNIIELSKFFLKEDLSAINQNKKELSSAYQEVIYNLWPQDNNIYRVKSYAPNNFKNVISKMNPLFDGIQANDSKDLIQFLLTEIHSELNVIKINNNRNNFPNYGNNNYVTSIYNFQEAFTKFSFYFMENYNSIISNIFFGMECSTNKCLFCNSSTYNVQCFNMLIFPLEKVRLFKGYNRNQYLTIRDCLECHRCPDYLLGENQIFCNKCHLNRNACNSTFLVYGPNVLIINLNRGKGLEYDVKINFEFDLDISNFVCNNKSPKRYELIGVVMHYGESSMSGHYIAYCKSKLDNIWYKYNDSIVTKADIREMFTAGIAYILFYHKI